MQIAEKMHVELLNIVLCRCYRIKKPSNKVHHTYVHSVWAQLPGPHRSSRFCGAQLFCPEVFFQKFNWSSRLLCTGLTSMVYDFAIRETPRTSISTARYFPFPSRTATPCERYSTLTATLAVATLSVCMLLTTTYAAPSGVQETSNRKGKKKRKKGKLLFMEAVIIQKQVAWQKECKGI